jgi:hypothetical protein
MHLESWTLGTNASYGHAPQVFIHPVSYLYAWDVHRWAIASVRLLGYVCTYLAHHDRRYEDSHYCLDHYYSTIININIIEEQTCSSPFLQGASSAGACLRLNWLYGTVSEART